ncbi:MAG: hypothetical protein IMHGJWDQ_000225 [Candidatus Fervidibacter sp.]
MGEGKKRKNQAPRRRRWDLEAVLPQLLRAAQGATVLNLLPSAIHELNNALNTILGFADLWGSDPSLPKTFREDLQTLSGSGLQARELLTILRFFAEGVPTEVQVVPVDVREVCKEVGKILAAAFRRHRARLIQNLEENVPTILSDAARLRFILSALLQNACEAIAHTGREGQIRLSVTRSSEGGITLIVEDDGTGFENAEALTNFVPFTTTKPTGKGAGLGLFLVRQLVEDLQGKLEVHSTPSGTRVTIHLPSLPLPSQV